MRLATATAVLCALLISAAPAVSAAAEEEFEGASAAFKLPASNGYSIVVLAGSRRADGRGELTLIVGKKAGGASYSTTRAIVTPDRVEADLGDLGRIAVDVVPTGRMRRVKPECGQDGYSYRRIEYRGTIEFHGEEGYADADATVAPDALPFFEGLTCSGIGSGESSGPGLPGARLKLGSRGPGSSLSLAVRKNRRDSVTLLEADLSERRDGLQISRSVEVFAPAAAFRYDPSLRTATLDPPAPFAGHASFRRAAERGWSGNLSVDFPGWSDLRLTGPGLRPSLVHSQWYREEIEFDRR